MIIKRNHDQLLKKGREVLVIYFQAGKMRSFRVLVNKICFSCCCIKIQICNNKLINVVTLYELRRILFGSRYIFAEMYHDPNSIRFLAKRYSNRLLGCYLQLHVQKIWFVVW